MKQIKLNPLTLVIGVALLMFGAYQLGSNGIGSSSLKTTGVVNYQTEGNKTVNFSRWGDDKSLAYFTGQIIVPKGYKASSDDMVTYYGTQGGMAPPRIILSKGGQALPKDEADYSYMDFGKNDCILVWSTGGFSSIDAWGGSISRFDGNLKNKETISVGNRTADIYQTTNKNKGKYVAYMSIGKNGTSYFFETCNLNNKSDFINVIKSIKFRPDLNL